MTRKEAERQTRQNDILRQLGFTYDEAESLRRISMALHNWHERENDDGTGRAFWLNNNSGHRYQIPDRETGARKRLGKIMERVNGERNESDGDLTAYIQGDPRGAALYIIRPGDVPAGADVGAYYNRGICVY